MSTPAPPFAVDLLDHLVLTVADVDATVAFYTRALGMRPATFEDGRKAVHFGQHKINLHEAGHEYEPKARRPTPGSTDLCLVTTTPIDVVVAHLDACRVALVDGPVTRTGAVGALLSVYVHDPDGNLIEVANRL